MWLIVGVSRDVVLELMLDAKPHSTLVTDVRPNALVDGPLVSLQSTDDKIKKHIRNQQTTVAKQIGMYRVPIFYRVPSTGY